MYKLIAMDLDDTLLTPDLEISDRTLRALKEVKEHQCIITIATGRMYVSSRKYIKMIGLDVEAITYNGAMVVDSHTDKVMVHHSLNMHDAREILDIAVEEKVYAQIYIDDECFTSKDGKEIDIYYKQTGVMPKPVGDLKGYMNAEPTKILYIADAERIKVLTRKMHEHFKDRLEITVSKPEYLEFLNKNASKGNALRDLAERLNIPREHIMAFGDSYNDISMIEYAHTGVAMGNAREIVRSKAQLVAPRNSEDGVAQILEKYVLQGVSV